MFIAVDEFNKRINIDDAEKGQQYFCPICHSPLMIRDGKINAKHYAHKAGECSDDWNYDMSEWHRRMQSYFDVENREVVVKHNGKVHRADVMVGDMVIEFQHSHISSTEFMDRNNFFHQLGKRIAWVFDVSDQYANESIYYSEEYFNRLIWKKPLRVFSAGEEIEDNLKNYFIWLYWEEDDVDLLSRVMRTDCDADGNPSLKRFIVSACHIRLNEETQVEPEDFFFSNHDYFKKIVLNEFKSKNIPYKVKYTALKGKPRDAYVCPKRPTEFGIRIYSEKGCLYCKYCYMAAQQEQIDEKDKWAVYCCYPTQVRRVNGELEGHPGYECNSADVYDL